MGFHAVGFVTEGVTPTPQTLKRATSSMSLAATGSKVFQELNPRGGHEIPCVSPDPALSHQHSPLLNHKKLMRAKRPKLYT